MSTIQEINNTQILNLCDNLAGAFNKSGLSLEEFSAMIGIPPTVIEEAIHKTPTDNFTSLHIARLSEYLQVRICDLF